MKKIKNLESFNSEKFNTDLQGRVLGGAPIYGPTQGTSYGAEGVADTKQKTTNPTGYPEGTSGWDNLVITKR